MRWAAVESGVLFGFVLLFIWVLRPHFPHFWIPLLLFVVVSFALRGQTPSRLGLRFAGFLESAIRYGPWAAMSGLLLASAVWFDGWRRISPSWAAGSLGLYCAWGLFQQTILNGYFLNRFLLFSRRPYLLAAILFSVVHAPNWFLMLVTLPAGYCAAVAYVRERNLYFLGLAHGVLGFLIYMAVPDSITRHLYVGPRWFGG